ncbi:heterokaryon incompatibility protein-domain-containing protein, partial [Lasiosphaeria hispida]
IRGWVHDCETSHEACRLQTTNTLASCNMRVVDVTQRAVISYDIQERPDYVALSYVWGGAKQTPVVLNVPFPGKLPRTIEDAMEVTRGLGKRYLWVDGLCIDQNNEEHKRDQIAIMDRIYRDAWATIINLSGTSAESSIPRISGDFHVRQTTYTTHDGDHFISTPPALAAYIRQSPWSSRAWVLQEALLSRRRIFFTP